MSSPFIVRETDDLHLLKRSRGLDAVEVNLARLKYRGLLSHALKYGLWALRCGGRLVIRDHGPPNARMTPYDTGHEFIRQHCFKLLQGQVRLVALDDAAMTLTFERVTETLEPGWSAGVIFSGDDEELAMLERCLDGLLAQPELVADGGEILVCGPPRNLDFLTRFPKVRYVEYEAETRPRFMIAAKKNFLVRALRNPRAAVMHVRIVLEPGCLAAMPHEFDVITPAVAYEHDGRRVRYLDYRILDFADPRRVPSTGLTLMIENPQRYLAKLHRGQPYIDGGLFIARRAVFETTALNEALAWGEAEDIEWCNRLYHAGYLIDMEPAANATSQTFKMHKSSLEQSPLIRQRHILARMRFLTRGWIRHRVGLITGER